MGRGRETILAAGTFALALAIIAVPAGARAEPDNPFAARLLDSHNSVRAQSGVPPLIWNRELAMQAQEWAEFLAGQGRMIHATREQRRHAGENLWMGAAGTYSAEFMVQAFVAEKRNFRPGTFPEVSATGQWRDVGHYTQIVWRDTTDVGCAVARNARDDFLVCRYSPAGNWYGKPVF